ncbi:prephenate dehydrogenase [Vagococcus sp. BWB3-3]|uniref:Prephenate dehydrogenase n=1 Tax=Vagococcus allomyrinae TaxID=2794353 RepID=A0A940P539_9ENTE|nr:prephenate dehydrogenase [Vagococcus allomyrinae]MBP1041734.1 prephenate dehydrogenase [Vagococcus allomyrinae]
MSETFRRVLIVGTGLIGGSLCLSIKKECPQAILVGMDANESSLEEALKVRAIDEIGTDFVAEVLKADLLLLCTPVKQTLSFLKEVDKLSLMRPLVISDVGSTKGEIMGLAETLTNDQLSFIGGHPMAGSHKSGFIAADVDLFENAYYVLTPSSTVSAETVDRLQALLKGTRGKFVEMTAAEHDQITGVVSHLPHIIASALVKHNQVLVKQLPMTKKLAAGGFRDITRIASSDPAMWTDILLSNQEVLVAEMKDWQKQMADILNWLERADKQTIFDFFASAKNARDALPQRKSGAIPAFNDLFVQVPDHPGEIAKVTGILAGANVSLTNLKIIENREDIFGTLQLTFKNQQDVKIAFNLLTKDGGYTCYEK